MTVFGRLISRRPLSLGEALESQLGSPRRVRRLASSPRSRVWSVELGGVPAVIKRVVGDAGGDARYERELTALRLAGRAHSPVVPALLGSDRVARILVLERLADLRPARDWPIHWAAALARLHAATSSADLGSLPAWQGPTTADVDAFLRLALALEVRVPAQVPRELNDLLDRLAPAGQHALLHGDPCPPNDLHGQDGVRFVDLEQASLGSGLVELAYLRIGFPTCWCVTAVPPAILARAEDSYSRSWTAASGTQLQADLTTALTDACVGWLLRGDALVQAAQRDGVDHLARLTRQDWGWGTATARQRLRHRLAAVAAGAIGRADLAGVQELTAAMCAQVSRRWPGTNPLPVTGGSATRTA